MSMPPHQSDAWILNRIQTLAPETAERIIEQAETANLRWSPAVIKALLEQAGKRAPEPAAPPEQPEPPEPPEPAGPEDIPF